jgi:hypothetical protein
MTLFKAKSPTTNEADFHLIMRAKRQIRREASWRSLLLFGLAIAAFALLFWIELSPSLFVALYAFVNLSGSDIRLIGKYRYSFEKRFDQLNRVSAAQRCRRSWALRSN